MSRHLGAAIRDLPRSRLQFSVSRFREPFCLSVCLSVCLSTPRAGRSRFGPAENICWPPRVAKPALQDDCVLLSRSIDVLRWLNYPPTPVACQGLFSNLVEPPKLPELPTLQAKRSCKRRDTASVSDSASRTVLRAKRFCKQKKPQRTQRRHREHRESLCPLCLLCALCG